MTDFSETEFEDPLSNYEPATYDSPCEQALAEKLVSDLDSQPMVTAPPSLTVREAIHKLRETKISSLLIVDGSRLLGIFTERDILEQVAQDYDSVADKPVTEFMTSDPLVVYSSDPASTALAAIAVAGHRHVPVIDGDEVVGILSPRRVFGFLDSVEA